MKDGERKILFFGNLSELKLFDLPYSVTKKFSKEIDEGDAFLIIGGECARIKAAID